MYLCCYVKYMYCLNTVIVYIASMNTGCIINKTRRPTNTICEHKVSHSSERAGKVFIKMSISCCVLKKIFNLQGPVIKLLKQSLVGFVQKRHDDDLRRVTNITEAQIT